MIRNRDLEPNNGVLTSSMNTQNKEFKELQLILKSKADLMDEKQKRQLELFALQVKIEDYLNENNDENHIIPVGEFLRLYINKLSLKQNKVAKYIGLDPTNFNKILSGNRKVNLELSFMLGKIFQLDPKIWMLIQLKNEYLELKKNKAEYFQQFDIEDLIGA